MFSFDREREECVVCEAGLVCSALCCVVPCYSYLAAVIREACCFEFDLIDFEAVCLSDDDGIGFVARSNRVRICNVYTLQALFCRQK